MTEQEAGGVTAKYRDNIYAIAFNYFRNGADADDIVQEVCLKYYQALRAGKVFEGEEHARNWLIRVAVNQCKKVAVSAWFRRRAPLEEYAKELYYENPEESDVFIAVMNLPKKYRAVVHLYYYEDYSTKEIAGLLAIKETTVTTRLMRARKKLKEQLSEVWKDE